LLLCI